MISIDDISGDKKERERERERKRVEHEQNGKGWCNAFQCLFCYLEHNESFPNAVIVKLSF